MMSSAGHHPYDTLGSDHHDPHSAHDWHGHGHDGDQHGLHGGVSGGHDPALGHAYAAEHFQPEHAASQHIAGDPSRFMPAWHWQHHNDTCAVVSQEFVLHSFGVHMTENQLAHLAHSCGFYNPGQGTPLGQTGSLLEAFGLTVHREHSTLDGLVRHLEHGDKVLVGVDAHQIWHDRHGLHSGVLGPAHANHAVQVIGVADYGSAGAKVILNDPGAPDGCGKLVPLDDFTGAWAAGDNFLAYVPAHAIPTLGHAVDKLFPALAGYAATATVMAADPRGRS
jgi:hypothetical protein